MMVNRMAGWWFQTFVYFPFHIWDNPPTIDELIFLVVVKTTNQYTITATIILVVRWMEEILHQLIGG